MNKGVTMLHRTARLEREANAICSRERMAKPKIGKILMDTVCSISEHFSICIIHLNGFVWLLAQEVDILLM